MERQLRPSPWYRAKAVAVGAGILGLGGAMVGASDLFPFGPWEPGAIGVGIGAVLGVARPGRVLGSQPAVQDMPPDREPREDLRDTRWWRGFMWFMFSVTYPWMIVWTALSGKWLMALFFVVAYGFALAQNVRYQRRKRRGEDTGPAMPIPRVMVGSLTLTGGRLFAYAGGAVLLLGVAIGAGLGLSRG